MRLPLTLVLVFVWFATMQYSSPPQNFLKKELTCVDESDYVILGNYNDSLNYRDINYRDIYPQRYLN